MNPAFGDNKTTAETPRRAHSVGRRLPFDFVDRDVDSHDSQDELVLQKINLSCLIGIIYIMTAFQRC